jgi:hypothetical protein
LLALRNGQRRRWVRQPVKHRRLDRIAHGHVRLDIRSASKMLRISRSSRRQISILGGVCSRFGAPRGRIGAAFSHRPGGFDARTAPVPKSPVPARKLQVPAGSQIIYLI